MKCYSCGQSVELTDGSFEPAGMWPESTVKRYSFRCKDCTKKVAIDGGPTTQNPVERTAGELEEQENTASQDDAWEEYSGQSPPF